MEIWKKKCECRGYHIYCKLGNNVYESWWGGPPKNIDHVDLMYLKERYSIITTEKRAEKFKKLWKKLWLEVTEEQLRKMKHCIGLDYKKKPFRNRFYCNKNDKNWTNLVKKGLAAGDSSLSKENENCYFELTKAGVEFILKRSISNNTYKEL